MRRIRVQRLFLYFCLITLGIICFLYFLSTRRNLKHEVENVSRVHDKIDWVNEDFEDKELLREGPGEHGEGVFLLLNETEEANDLMRSNGFNALISDRISLNRATKDLRVTNCKFIKYDKILPPVSIIIPFHNEHWSTLLRTVHSYLSRTPPNLIQEVILVDDNSSKAFLGQNLTEYISQNFKNVRLLRTEKREGLIRARLIGAKEANGTILIFTDSHCEAGVNWLPPLIQPIRHHYKTVTCPFIDVIHNENFAILPQDEGSIGGFDWNLDYKRFSRKIDYSNHPEKPFETPVMSGGLFAISKQWFWELGGYDPGLDIWGGEQYELSFKVWMCGGTILDIPCSRIAHVYRKFNLFNSSILGDYISRNYKRVAEVWMDDWKKYVYNKDPKSYSLISPGDIDEQINLREKLKCKSFNWFMENVGYEILEHYPVIEPESTSIGKIFSVVNNTMCISSNYGKQGDLLKISKCRRKKGKRINDKQDFDFTWRTDFRISKKQLCFEYPGYGSIIFLNDCHVNIPKHHWLYNPDSHQIVHVLTNKCLDSDLLEGSDLFMNQCSANQTQKWILENVNEEILNKRWMESKIR